MRRTIKGDCENCKHSSTLLLSSEKIKDSRQGTICSVCESGAQPGLESESPSSRRVALGEVDMKFLLSNELSIHNFSHHFSFQLPLFYIYIKMKYIFYIENLNIIEIFNKESE